MNNYLCEFFSDIRSVVVSQHTRPIKHFKQAKFQSQKNVFMIIFELLIKFP